MSDRSAIEWTDATWNPTRGCSPVSPGCANCYAMRVAYRFSGPGKAYEGLAKMTKGVPRWTGTVRQSGEHLFDPLRWKKPRRIFVNSMSDLFHEAMGPIDVAHVWGVMYEGQWHTFQVLTKRADLMHAILTHKSFLPTVAAVVHSRMTREKAAIVPVGDIVADLRDNWPLPNVWLGASVENQEWADKRIPSLIETPAAVRFVSCEPLLGPIDLGFFGVLGPAGNVAGVSSLDLHWVIAGGESGPGARPMHPNWARGLRDQCASAGVPFFFKQWGEWQAGSQRGAPSRIMLHDGANIPETRAAIDAEQGADKPEWNSRRPTVVARVGKKAAGRLLDGRQHSDFPKQ